MNIQNHSMLWIFRITACYEYSESQHVINTAWSEKCAVFTLCIGAERTANSVDPDQMLHSIRVYTIYQSFISIRHINIYFVWFDVLGLSHSIRAMYSMVYQQVDWLIVLWFNNTSIRLGHFVSSPREREKRDRRDSRDKRAGLPLTSRLRKSQTSYPSNLEVPQENLGSPTFLPCCGGLPFL